MLVTKPVARARMRAIPDESGAVLVTVVVVMFVGFIIAATVAASVVFTITANDVNKDRTEAFIAAESGRDQVRAQLANGCVDVAELHAEGTVPMFVADARYVSRITAASAPTSFDDAGLTSACPTVLSGDDDGWIVIRSTGTGPDGSTTMIDSVYPWTVNYELQAGGVLAYFASGVSLRGTYAGDIVVRGGDYNCASEGTLDGDLYVTRGKATFSRDCTVYGDVWTYGDVDGSAQRINISGNVKAGGVDASGGTVSADVNFTSNGTVIGTEADPETGAIEATGSIDLTDTGSTDGHVWGGLTAGGSISVGSKWVLDPSPTPSPSTAPPPFEPTLEFIRSITAWMDLDEASDWGVAIPISACSLSASDLLSELTDGGTAPVMFDYRGCGSVSTDITLDGPASNVVTKDAIFLAPSGKRMNLNFESNMTGGKQLIFVHADSDRGLNAGETEPDCGNPSAGQRDTFSVGNSLSITGVKVMVYAPCGLTGTVNSSFQGQLYSNDTSGVAFISTAEYTCATMQWPPAFAKLGCKVRGGGVDDVIVEVLVGHLDNLTYQTER